MERDAAVVAAGRLAWESQHAVIIKICWRVPILDIAPHDSLVGCRESSSTRVLSSSHLLE